MFNSSYASTPGSRTEDEEENVEKMERELENGAPSLSDRANFVLSIPAMYLRLGNPGQKLIPSVCAPTSRIFLDVKLRLGQRWSWVYGTVRVTRLSRYAKYRVLSVILVNELCAPVSRIFLDVKLHLGTTMLPDIRRGTCNTTTV